LTLQKKKGENGDDWDDILTAEEQELSDLAEGIEDEERTMAQEMGAENEDGDMVMNEDLDELDEWIDEVSNEMSREEQLVLAANI
jgi:cob(I)alamin adenosyltransferase